MKSADSIGSLLEDVSGFLNRQFEGRPIVTRVGDSLTKEVAHQDARRINLRLERPDRTVVLVLGEFKAGKSTLINALIGRTVAATDVFELTQVVQRIVPISDTRLERVEMFRARAVEPECVFTLEAFLDLASERKLTGFSTAIAYVVSDFDIVLMDTPGLGATLQNEQTALNALEATDMVLCLVDGMNLGGGLDAAIIAQMNELSLPYVCVLNKVDVIDPAEFPLVQEYLLDNLQIPPESLFAVSATRQIKEGNDPGLLSLRRFLIEDAPQRGTQIRAQALSAQARDIAGGYAPALHEVCSHLAATLEKVEEYGRYLNEAAHSITQDICLQVRNALNDRLNFIVSELPRSSEEPLTESDLAQALSKGLEKHLTGEFMETLQRQLSRRDQEEWATGIKEHLRLLQANLEQMRASASKHAVDEMVTLENHARYKQEAVTEAVWHTIGSVSAAAMGFVFTPALFLSIPFGLSAWRNFVRADQAGNEANEYTTRRKHDIDEWRETVVSAAVSGFHETLLKLNIAVAYRSLENYASKGEDWPVSPTKLRPVYAEGSALATRLDAARSKTGSAP